MSANVIQLPERVERNLEPVNLELDARVIAKALGGSGVLLQGRSQRLCDQYFYCHCPLCGGGLRIANHAGHLDHLAVDCAKGCAAPRVVAELARLGHMRCRSGWWRG